MNGIKFGLSFMLMLLLAACSSAPPKDHYYRMMVNENGVLKKDAPLLTQVVVQEFRVLGLLKERGIVYTPQDRAHEVHQYHYHAWIESPSVLFQQLMVDVLRQTKMADLVVTPEMNARTDYEIRGRVNRFELVRGSSPAVVVKMELMLRSLKQRKMLYLGRYQREVALSTEDIQVSVNALSDAVNQIYQDFLNEIVTQL